MIQACLAYVSQRENRLRSGHEANYEAIAELLIAHKADIEAFFTSPLYSDMICFEIIE